MEPTNDDRRIMKAMGIATDKKRRRKPKLIYGRLYKAYFFEQPIELPISALVLATSFESALELIREQFPNRFISGLHGECGSWDKVQGCDAIIVEPGLPDYDFDIERNYQGVPKEIEKYMYNRKR